jgi:TetR/AcrR family transcriptional repressor of nem operon
MPYSPEHKRDTREKILESARRLFNRKGYAGVSIEEIMREAGLTHGGFYRHFTGKDALFAAAVRQFLCQKKPATWQQRQRKPKMRAKPQALRVADAYFSRAHFDDHDGCCPLIGMTVQRGGATAKAAYEEVVVQLVAVFEKHLNGPKARTKARERARKPARESALALSALCVGGMVLARNVGDPDLADDLRRAAHAAVMRTLR